MLQKIVVDTRLGAGDLILIRTGILLAVKFGKELCLFHQVTGNYQSGLVDTKLKEYQDVLHRDFPDLPVSLLVGSYRREKLALHLADEYEAIILVAAASRFSYLSVSLQSSPIPYLFINEQTKEVPDFNRIVFPVDLRRQNTDAFKWILYFGKYHQSEIIAIGANDKQVSNRESVHRNLNALKTMLSKYSIAHKIYRGSLNSLRVHLEGFETAEQLQAGMLVILGSSTLTILDLLIGLPEKKIVEKAGQFGVLVINPRRETYLVCE
jgi:hypothetical protein